MRSLTNPSASRTSGHRPQPCLNCDLAHPRSRVPGLASVDLTLDFTGKITQDGEMLRSARDTHFRHCHDVPSFQPQRKTVYMIYIPYINKLHECLGVRANAIDV